MGFSEVVEGADLGAFEPLEVFTGVYEARYRLRINPPGLAIQA
jgi:hypothetical protein